MDRNLLILLACRLLQFLFAAVVLALSVQLATRLKNLDNACDALYGEKDCKLYGLIPAIRYCAFVGVFGIIDLLAGAAGLFLDLIPFLVVLGLDGLAAIFYLAGGVRIAILLANPICQGGSSSECTKIKSDSAFLFLGFLMTLALMALGFFWRRGGGSGKLHSAV